MLQGHSFGSAGRKFRQASAQDEPGFIRALWHYGRCAGDEGQVSRV